MRCCEKKKEIEVVGRSEKRFENVAVRSPLISTGDVHTSCIFGGKLLCT